MRVLHVIPSISTGEGGPSAAIRVIARELSAAGIDVDVATTDDDGRGKRLSLPVGCPSIVDGMRVIAFPKQLHFYKVSLPFRAWLMQHVRDYDLVHIHALFSFTSTVAALIARKQGVPYIIRPLGLLNRYGMTQRKPLLKSLAYRFLDGPALNGASCIHYTSTEERDEAREAGVIAPSRIIPLGIDLSPDKSPATADLFFSTYPECRSGPLVLFMSRLDPKKGLEVLLDALPLVLKSVTSARLVIAGRGEASYEHELRQKAQELGVADRITWTGFVEGAMKASTFAAATVYTLPSYSENFGIAAVEALAAGLPCVLSENVAVASTQVRQANAGLVTPTEPLAIAEALTKLLTDSDLRADLGSRAKLLVGEKFSSKAMATSLAAIYRELVRPRA